MTGKEENFVREIEISPGAIFEVCEIKATLPVKVKIQFFCKYYEAEESFAVQIIDQKTRIVIDDSFVPAFGNFSLETELSKEVLPAKVILKSLTKDPRKLHSRVRYVEILA